MKKIVAILLVLAMVVIMVASCTDNDGPIVVGAPPTYGEESTPAKPTQSKPNNNENTGGGDNIDLPVDIFP